MASIELAASSHSVAGHRCHQNKISAGAGSSCVGTLTSLTLCQWWAKSQSQMWSKLQCEHIWQFVSRYLIDLIRNTAILFAIWIWKFWDSVWIVIKLWQIAYLLIQNVMQLCPSFVYNAVLSSSDWLWLTSFMCDSDDDKQVHGISLFRLFDEKSYLLHFRKDSRFDLYLPQSRMPKEDQHSMAVQGATLSNPFHLNFSSLLIVLPSW